MKIDDYAPLENWSDRFYRLAAKMCPAALVSEVGRRAAGYYVRGGMCDRDEDCIKWALDNVTNPPQPKTVHWTMY